MKKLLLVKYASEIFLKGLNRNKFEKKLRDNISQKLKGLDFELIIDQNRYFIDVDDISEGINRVKKVFGVSKVCVVEKIDRDYDKIKEKSLLTIRLVNIGKC